MTTIINHDLRCIDGKTITMPPYIGEQNGWGNLAIPNVYATPVATGLYPIGTAFRTDERAFRYVHFGLTTGTTNAFTTQVGVPMETGYLMGCTSKPIASVSCTDPTHDAYEVVCVLGVDTTLDEYAGGYLYAHSIGNQFGCRITGNDAVTAGSNVTFDIEAPWPDTYEVLESTNLTVNHSPWRHVVAHSGGYNMSYNSVLGVQIIYNHGTTPGHTFDNYYGWIQTWGPCHVQANMFGGTSVLERAVFARTMAADFAPTTHGNQQYIGFLMQETASGTDADRPYVWLQLCP